MKEGEGAVMGVGEYVRCPQCKEGFIHVTEDDIAFWDNCNWCGYKKRRHNLRVACHKIDHEDRRKNEA